VTPTTERVRRIRERLFEDGAVVARADGGRRELFPVAIGAADDPALLAVCRVRVSPFVATVEAAIHRRRQP
jgi:hypothetical protein